MVMAFAYIYNTVVNSQIRVILSNLPETQKIVALWLHPVILIVIRVYNSKMRVLAVVVVAFMNFVLLLAVA